MYKKLLLLVCWIFCEDFQGFRMIYKLQKENTSSDLSGIKYSFDANKRFNNISNLPSKSSTKVDLSAKKLNPKVKYNYNFLEHLKAKNVNSFPSNPAKRISKRFRKSYADKLASVKSKNRNSLINSVNTKKSENSVLRFSKNIDKKSKKSSVSRFAGRKNNFRSIIDIKELNLKSAEDVISKVYTPLKTLHSIMTPNMMTLSPEILKTSFKATNDNTSYRINLLINSSLKAIPKILESYEESVLNMLTNGFLDVCKNFELYIISFFDTNFSKLIENVLQMSKDENVDSDEIIEEYYDRINPLIQKRMEYLKEEISMVVDDVIASGSVLFQEIVHEFSDNVYTEITNLIQSNNPQTSIMANIDPLDEKKLLASFEEHLRNMCDRIAELSSIALNDIENILNENDDSIPIMEKYIVNSINEKVLEFTKEFVDSFLKEIDENIEDLVENGHASMVAILEMCESPLKTAIPNLLSSVQYGIKDIVKSAYNSIIETVTNLIASKNSNLLERIKMFFVNC
ncbi:hypothetical protein EDEG_03217 [Edhazardia aedis USNM 41457]|uniref:Uncharacterized protein n=1 Tax=Edhazardia aedis (strain USNM 41457) TaxID=1003232 RepID=J8ZRN5_EDHAE|nr:hypothetical protein EDEG_03217 [Edhazardia aedis USNM 41457]|eukprot:EJW02358.1 hypothetical protein EDEG_03217 [Edhazardia aedis USNM 41457]